MFSIGTIIISDETILLLSVGVSKIRIDEESDLEQGTSNQRTEKMLPSKPKDFYLGPKISLEDRFIQKPIIIIAKLILKWMRHQPKYR